jgi:hypothetical protein
MKTMPGYGLSAVALALVGLVLSNPVARADEHPHAEHMLKCARVCGECQIECDSCFAHCKGLLTEGKKEHAKTLQTCVDCSECCSLAAKLSARSSPFAVAACECCAKCCDECAAECEKFKSDEHMARCAKSCRACAKECRDMIQHLKK